MTITTKPINHQTTAQLTNGNQPHTQELLLNIKKIQESMTEIRNDISNATKQINSIRNEISKEENNTSRLKSILQKYGDNSPVRLKAGNYKYGESDNFIKNAIYGKRYQSERMNAAKELGFSSGPIQAKEAKSILESRLSNYEKNLQVNEETVQSKTRDFKELKQRDYMLQMTLKDMMKVNPSELKINRQNKADEKNLRLAFTIYKTNEGCRAINASARSINTYSTESVTPSFSKIIKEYDQDLFNKDGEEIKRDIKSKVKDENEFKGLVKLLQEKTYMPSKKTITTYRGQGMTTQGIEKLCSTFQTQPNKVYRSPHLFSTSGNESTAQRFAENLGGGEVSVLFKVTGNSSAPCAVLPGFDHIISEKERIYSPKAEFAVQSIVINDNNAKSYMIELKEVRTKQIKNAEFLPY